MSALPDHFLLVGCSSLAHQIDPMLDSPQLIHRRLQTIIIACVSYMGWFLDP
jgi:hypothetical protein